MPKEDDENNSLALFSEVYNSLIGLEGILRLALEKTHAEVKLNTPVTRITPCGGLYLVETPNGTFEANHVVFATNPLIAAGILSGSNNNSELIALLEKFEYKDLIVSMQKPESCYMPSNNKQWEGVNIVVDDDTNMFTFWFGALREAQDGSPLNVFRLLAIWCG